MLKKNNKILVGCLALLLVMAVGYALFSETITINGTATAKGEFNMQITCIKGIVSEITSLEDYGLDPEGGYENDTCQVNDNDMTFNVNFLYPGARRYFTAKITNTGTIDAILKEDSITNSDKYCEDKNNNGTIEDNECETGDTDRLIDMWDVYGFEKANGSVFSGQNIPESEVSEFYDINEEAFILKPGNSMYFFLFILTRLL